jgi:prophage maintenance system killer protein
MNDQFVEFVDGHYVVTLADALETHERICRPDDDPAVLMPEQLAGALDRPYNGYFPELWQKAAALMESFAGSQIFLTANKRTAIALVNLLVTRSGHELHPLDNEQITKAIEELSKTVGRGDMKREALNEWYRLRLRRFAG